MKILGLVLFIAMLVVSAAMNGTLVHRRLSDSPSKPSRQRIRIVVYDKIRGYLNWMQEWFKEAAIRKCNTVCLLSDNLSELGNADIVLFHAPTHEQNAPAIPTRHPANLLFAMISLEQPNYAKVLSRTSYLEKNFDLLATYSRESIYPGTNIANLPITYFPLNIVSINSLMQAPRPFAEKTGYGTGVTVAVFTSNCKAAGATGRYQYLEELMKLIPIHSFGTCLHNREEPELGEDGRWPPLAQRRARKVKILSNYKFYLAFENLAVDDYVSEKIFEGYFAGTLPIYRGTENIGHFVPTNDSFINANGMSPTQLASLLKRLGDDEKEYKKYFEFKSRPLRSEFEEIALRSYTHPNILCRLCDIAAGLKQDG